MAHGLNASLEVLKIRRCSVVGAAAADDREGTSASLDSESECAESSSTVWAAATDEREGSSALIGSEAGRAESSSTVGAAAADREGSSAWMGSDEAAGVVGGSESEM